MNVTGWWMGLGYLSACERPLPGGADASSGCASPPRLDSGIHTLEDQGVTRTFRLHVPPSASAEPAPLVVVFHGWGGDEDEFLGNEDVTAEADRRGYIVVAPAGLGPGSPDRSPASWSFAGSTTGLDPDGAAICDEALTPDYRYPSCRDPQVAQNGCSWTQCQADDVAFARALVETIASDLCVDPRRVYAAGGSNGGMFTWELGRRNAEAPVFAALAPLVGLPHAGYLAADGALPVLLLTGTEDPVVPPGDWEDASPTTSSSGQDRFYYTGATAITRSWARARGCDVTVDALPYDDGDPRTDCRTYCADADVPPVLDCRAEQGHVYGLSWTWPLVLDFFDAHAG